MRARIHPLLPVALIASVAIAAVALYAVRRAEPPASVAFDGPSESGAEPSTVAASAPSDVSTTEIVLDAARDRSARSPSITAAGTESRSPLGARAELVVSTVSGSDGRVLAGVAVSLVAPEGTTGSLMLGGVGTESAGHVAQSSDDDGRTLFDVESSVDFVLLAEDVASNLCTDIIDVSALDPGERRAVTLKLVPGSGSRLYGRIQDCEGNVPLEGATVSVCRAVNASVIVGGTLYREQIMRHVIAGADGRFELAFPTWRRAYLWIRAPGFGPVLSEIRSDGGTLEKPQVVCVEKSAALEVQLTDGFGGPIAGAQVRVVARAAQIRNALGIPVFPIEGLGDIEWKQRADALGRCRFDDLPARVSLRVDVALDGESRHKDEREVFLRPGEVNELAWTLGAGCRVTGRIVDQEGHSRRFARIVLRRPERTGPCVFTSPGAYEDSTRVDADGRFSFDDVAPGTWWVGAVASAGAGLPVVIEIGPATRSREVLLAVHQGLSITGRVLDPTGQPAVGASVMALEAHGGCTFGAQTREDGSFTVGPLLPGSYRVSATWFMRHADSDVAIVDAGEDGVELTLRAGGKLRGVVVDSTMSPRVDATLHARSCSRPDRRYFVIDSGPGRVTLARGDFTLRGLEPGIYDVWATTSDALFGLIAGVEVSVQREASGLALPMRPGGHLRLCCDDESDRGEFEVWVNDALLYAEELRLGFTKPLVVPAGPIRLAYTNSHGQRRERVVTITAGEDRFISVARDP